MAGEDELTQLVQARGPALVGCACLLTGSLPAAEDLVHGSGVHRHGASRGRTGVARARTARPWPTARRRAGLGGCGRADRGDGPTIGPARSS
ncbi:hypothetical protein FHR80_001306 [Cellulomonas cellasea]|uniref:Uncharacterized protein n=1 Tax=Cellulomonas cellasea TaxID=43670 RepID=A0A7W4UDX3_9CELL|nr:hypothetical protein [Cellulomonas cellasea]